MHKFKYTTSFSSVVRCLINEEADKFLSKASLDNLKNIIPANFQNEIDLLPIAFNACVVNRANRNDDLISTDTALKIYSSFVSRPINVEHNRQNIIGNVVNAALSKFDANYAVGSGSDLLEIDEVKASKDPFNIALAGVIYKVISDDLVDFLAQSSDPDSPRYLSISASWELGFDEYNIVVGSKDLAESKIISDPDEIKKFDPYLKANGGKGVMEDGKYVFRMLVGNVFPLGIGLTKSPAAEVQGLVVSTASEVQNNNIQETSSQTPKDNVKDSSMKILTSVAQLKTLKQEELAEYSVASVSEMIDLAIKEANEKYVTELKAKETAVADVEKMKKDLEVVSSELNALKTAQEKQAATQRFNDRMSHLDEEFELTDGDRQVIANQIKEIDDKSFEKWMSDFSVLAAAKKKKKKVMPVKPVDPKEETEVVASVVAPTPEEVAAAALKNVTPVVAPIVPTSSAPSDEMAKYRKAFSIEGFNITK